MDPLFPVITVKGEQEEAQGLPSGWQTIGRNLHFLEKKEVPAEKTPPQRVLPKSDNFGQSIEEQQKRYYGINNRVRASDMIDKELQKEKKKKEKKKKREKEEKKRKRKEEKLVRQQLTVLPSEAELDAYFDKKLEEEKVLDPRTDFLYNHTIKQGLYPITVMRFGEEDNYKYGLKVGKVPKFRRLNFNIIVGLIADSITQDILDDLNAVQGITKRSRAPPDDANECRYFHDLKLAQSTGESFFRNDKIYPDMEELKAQDFISFSETQIVEETSEKEKDPLEFSFERGDLSKSEYTIMQRQKQLNKDLEKNPADLALWLEFLAFQDQGIAAGKNKQAVIEKKISIVEKAMTNKELENDETLIFMHLKFLDAANKNDDFYKVLHGIWTKYLDRNFSKAFFWAFFLDFKYSKFSKFSATFFRENISAHFKDVCTKIKEEADLNRKRSLKKVLLVILNKVTFIEKEMGFLERGLGILQAVLEWNVFGRGSSTSFFQDKKLKEFQNYWEKRGSLRTGEVTDLGGWEEMKNFSDQDFSKKLEDPSFLGHIEAHIQKASENERAFDFEASILKEYADDPNSDIIKWFSTEKEADTWRPANIGFDTARIKTSADSVVFFEDVEPYLFFFNDESLNTNIMNLLLSYLDFPTLDQKFFGSIESSDFICGLQTRIEQQFKGINAKGQLPGLNWLDDLGTMDLLIKFKNLPFLCDSAMQGKRVSVFEYVRRLLLAFMKKSRSEEVLIYLFAMECVYYLGKEEGFTAIHSENSKEAGKRLKNFLKENEKNYLLWCLYAEIEFIKSRDISKAEKVFHNVIQFINSNTERLLVIYLYSTFYLRNQKILEEAGVLLQAKLSICFQYLERILKNEAVKEIPSEKEIPPLQLKLLSLACKKQLEARKDFSRKSTGSKKLPTAFPLKKKSVYLYFHNLIELGAKNSDSEVLTMIEEMHQRKMYKLAKLFGSERKSKKIAYFEQHQLHLLNLLRIKKFTNIFQNHREKHSLYAILKSSISRYPYNQTFTKEFVYLNSQLAFKPNRLLQLKEQLGFGAFSMSVWLLYLFIENLDKNASQADPVHKVHSLFKRIIQEENLYDRILTALKSLNKLPEAKYSINMKLNNNLLSRAKLLDLFLLHLLGFCSQMPKDSFTELYKKGALLAVHMSPFSKSLYLNYVVSCLNDEKSFLEAYKIMANKEMRLYGDPQEMM